MGNNIIINMNVHHLILKTLSAPYTRPTHVCGSLSTFHLGKSVILAGWILSERSVKSINKSFYNFFDHSGISQLSVDHHHPTHLILQSIPPHSTLLIHGNIVKRPSTDNIDVHVNHVKLLNPLSTHLPFDPRNQHIIPNQQIRARYRYLDLRRPSLAQNLKKRSDVAKIIRQVLYDNGTFFFPPPPPLSHLLSSKISLK